MALPNILTVTGLALLLNPAYIDKYISAMETQCLLLRYVRIGDIVQSDHHNQHKRVLELQEILNELFELAI